jgi:hypothetical protein
MLPSLRLNRLRALERIRSMSDHDRRGIGVGVIQEVLVDAQVAAAIPLAARHDRHAHLGPLCS